MDEKSSWMRFAITIAIDWRFVLAVVFLVLALLLSSSQLPAGNPPLPGLVKYIAVLDRRCVVAFGEVPVSTGPTGRRGPRGSVKSGHLWSLQNRPL